MENQDRLTELLNKIIDWEGIFYRLQKSLLLKEGLEINFKDFSLGKNLEISYYEDTILNRQPSIFDLLVKKIVEIDTVVVQGWQRPEVLKKIALSEDDELEVSLSLGKWNKRWQGSWKSFNNKQDPQMFFDSFPEEMQKLIREKQQVNFKIKLLKLGASRIKFEQALGLENAYLDAYLDSLYTEQIFHLKFNPPQKTLAEKLLRMEIFGQKFKVDSSAKLEKVLSIVSFRDLPVRTVVQMRCLMEYVDCYEITLEELFFLIKEAEDPQKLKAQYHHLQNFKIFT